MSTHLVGWSKTLVFFFPVIFGLKLLFLVAVKGKLNPFYPSETNFKEDSKNAF